MKKLNASGAIGMLLAMLIIALLFILMMPTLKNTSSTGLGESPINKESVEEQVNQQVNEIEKIRQQTVEMNNKATQEY